MATSDVVAAERSSRYGALTRAAIEAAVLGSLFLAYKSIRHEVAGRVDVAFANAHSVLHLERWLHLDFEASLQRAALHSRELVEVLNRYYVSMHFATTVVFLTWLYVARRDHYAHIRRLLVGSTAMALVLHVAYPLAPPRMMGGFVDTMARYGPNAYASGRVASLANQYAAMPSVHFAWAVLVAYGVVRCLHSRWRWVAVAHPVLTLTAIIVTANHYWLDAAVAGCVFVVTFACERAFVHWRESTRDSWRYRTA